MPQTAPVESRRPARKPARRAHAVVIEKEITFQVRMTKALRAAIEARYREDKFSTASEWARAVLARAVDKGAFGNWKPDAPKTGGHRARSKRTDA